jgi:Zn-finger protein
MLKQCKDCEMITQPQQLSSLANELEKKQKKNTEIAIPQF